MIFLAASNSPSRSHQHSLSDLSPSVLADHSTLNISLHSQSDLPPPLSADHSTANLSLDSLSSTHSSISSHGGVANSVDHTPNLLSVSSKSEDGLEGEEVRVLSDYSSGVNSVGGTPHSGSVASIEEKVGLPDPNSVCVYVWPHITFLYSVLLINRSSSTLYRVLLVGWQSTVDPPLSGPSIIWTPLANPIRLTVWISDVHFQ